jgi:riboflavin kinase / FMN adenylyltransferase
VSVEAARFGGPRQTRGPSVVSVGVFDGLHLGHRAILERAIARARERAARAVVVSFEPHPDVVLRPGPFHAPAPLTPLEEKRERLLAMGVDELEVIPFTRELARLEPEDFVREYLVRPFHPLALVVGKDFALGRGRSGDVKRLAAIGEVEGFEVEPVPLLDLEGERVSSTRIRELLSAGKVAEAARLLGRRYSLEGTVVTGHGMGRALGFPTANLRLHEEKLLPSDGIYAGWAAFGERREWRPAALSIGVRPTFDGRERQIEAFVLDWSGDLVGHEMGIELVDWIRPELRFESAAALIEAMGEDVAETRRRLARTAGPSPRLSASRSTG